MRVTASLTAPSAPLETDNHDHPQAVFRLDAVAGDGLAGAVRVFERACKRRLRGGRRAHLAAGSVDESHGSGTRSGTGSDAPPWPRPATTPSAGSLRSDADVPVHRHPARPGAPLPCGGPRTTTTSSSRWGCATENLVQAALAQGLQGEARFDGAGNRCARDARAHPSA